MRKFHLYDLCPQEMHQLSSVNNKSICVTQSFYTTVNKKFNFDHVMIQFMLKKKKITTLRFVLQLAGWTTRPTFYISTFFFHAREKIIISESLWLLTFIKPLHNPPRYFPYQAMKVFVYITSKTYLIVTKWKDANMLFWNTHSLIKTF